MKTARAINVPRGTSRWLTLLAAVWAALAALAPALAGNAPQVPPLTTASGNPRLPGKFVWADLVTDNVPAAQKFYAEVFGWSFRNVGNYVVGSLDDRPIAGLFQLDRPKDRAEARPRWFGYISVPNVERAQRAVTKAGGRVIAAPRELPKRGEQAVFADPEGALFGVVKSSSGDPEDFLAEPGEWIWMQLLSLDGRKAAEFYRGVAGYEVVENTTAGGLSDYVLVSKGYARATVRTIQQAKKVRPAWLPFVRVKSITDCVTQVGRNGGKVVIAPSAQLLEGKLAVIADPTGAEIGVLEWSNPSLKGGR